MIVRIGKAFGGEALVSTDPHGHGTLLYDRVSESNRPLQKYLRWSDAVHGRGSKPSVEHVDELEDVLDEHEVVHISFSGGCRSMQSLMDELGSELQVVRSATYSTEHSPTLHTIEHCRRRRRQARRGQIGLF